MPIVILYFYYFHDDNNGMEIIEIEDNYRHQLMLESMNKMNDINNLMEQLISQRESQYQTIELDVVMPSTSTPTRQLFHLLNKNA